MFVYNVVYEDSFRLLNSLFSCPLDAYLECEMKLPSPTRMTSFFVSSIFFSATKKTLTEVAFGHKDHHHYQSYDTYFSSLYPRGSGSNQKFGVQSPLKKVTITPSKPT